MEQMKLDLFPKVGISATNYPHKITNPMFFELGKAIFTISNPNNEHFTYKIKMKKLEKDSFWFIYLLTGPDNTSSYTYLGCYVPSIHGIRLTAKSKLPIDSKPVKVLTWAIKKVVNQEAIPEGYKIQHEGKCGRCGRLLTTPESITRGIGPECFSKIGK